MPYRPLTEAFLAAFRSAPRPTSPELAGFGAHLGRLVPAWSAAEAGVDDSPLMMGEAVVRLLRPMGACLLVLEDLHWADAETVAVLDHLADALIGESTLVLGTTRVEGALTEVLERLVRRDPSSVLPVAPLEDGGVDRMVTSCLATPAPPPEVGAFLRARSEGVPLVVEELLAGLVTAGELRLEQGRWSSPGELTAHVPASLRESVARRLATLDPVPRRVVGAAAVLGRRFDWELVPGIADVDGRAAADALRTLVDRQLVEVDGHGFAFRHALTREAVLDDLLPPDRRELARRARPVVERANPGLPGSSCELVAELAEAAGDPVAAASYLVESTRRALADGAVASAEITVRRARRLAGDDEAVRRDVDEVAVRRARRRRQAPGGARDRAGPGEPDGRHRRSRRSGAWRSCSPWPAPRSAPGTCPARWATSRRHGPRRTGTSTTRWPPASRRSTPTSPSSRAAPTTPRRWREAPWTPPSPPGSPPSSARGSRSSGGSPATSVPVPRRDGSSAPRGSRSGRGWPPGTCGPGTSWP